MPNRLTDIKTEEVSLVDRAANKRKFIITKNDGAQTTMAKKTATTNMMMEVIDPNGDTNMSKITKGETSNISTETVVGILDGLTQSLQKITDVTDAVKTFTEASATAVEKGVQTVVPLEDWGKSLKDVQKSIEGLFTLCPPLTGEKVKTEEEIATEKAAEDKAAADKLAADEAAKVAAAKAEEDAKVAKAKEAFDAVKKSITDIKTELSAVKTPSTEVLATITKKLENVYISGGLMVDTYDIASLEKVCSAIRTVVNAEDGANDVAKSAELTLSEAIEKIGKVEKRLESASSITDKEGKDLKVAELLVKSVVKDLDGNTTQTTTTATPPVDVEKLVAEKVAAAVEAAVTKATEGFKKEVDALKIQKTELETKLAKAVSSDTQVRGSSGEPTTTTTVDESKLFPLDYNA